MDTRTDNNDLLTWEFEYCFLIVALSLLNSYLFISKMQSYKRAIGEVSVTVSNAPHSCMRFCHFCLYIFMFVTFEILWYVISL